MAPTAKSSVKRSIRNAKKHLRNAFKQFEDVEEHKDALSAIYEERLQAQQKATQTIAKKWSKQKRRMKKMTKQLQTLRNKGRMPPQDLVDSLISAFGVTESIVAEIATHVVNEHTAQSRLNQNHTRLCQIFKQSFGNVKSADMEITDAQRSIGTGTKGASAPVPITLGYVAHSHDSRTCELHNRIHEWDTLFPTTNNHIRIKKPRSKKATASANPPR